MNEIGDCPIGAPDSPLNHQRRRIAPMDSRLYPIILASAIAIAGCARSPEDIPANDVAVSPYEAMACPQLASQANALDAQLAAVSKIQSDAAHDDAMGVALLGLPLGSMQLGYHGKEIADLKGQRAAVTQAQQVNQCLARS